MASPSAPAGDLRAGLVVDGRYELVAPMAKGGMGVVWLARRRGAAGFARAVAIKTIATELESDPVHRAMFLDEVRVTSRIRHPNVAEVVDVIELGGRLLMVMELVEGVSCATLVYRVQSGDPVPLGIVLAIVAGAARGLDSAHDLCGDDGAPLGLIHRDVSPSNVLVTRHGVPKLIDFGVARSRGRISGETMNDGLKGKISFMPPEQAAKRALDRRADVWGLCATFYAMVAGHPPHVATDEDLVDALANLLMRAPPKPLPSHVPQEVASIILRGLAHDPSERFATAAEVATACDAVRERLGLRDDVASFVAKLVDERSASAPPATLREDETTRGSTTEATERGEPPAPPRQAPMPSDAPPPPRRRRWAPIAGVVFLATSAVAIVGVGLRSSDGAPASGARASAAPSTPSPPTSTEADAAATVTRAPIDPPADAGARVVKHATRPRPSAPVKATGSGWKGVDDGF